MSLMRINLTLKIQGGSMYFLKCQYFECKQADIEWTNNKVSKNKCLQKLRFRTSIDLDPEGGQLGI